ncbi:ricin-type beta-trefoil lectin domain protein [Streptomyces sp. SCSIO 30461]|uniref:ricin-type beta-trefoil lectin domain protein n=1 Tax=Streptomyces sp. SCSIO 30461 TaxID=3118085 RepID=UPI0030CCF950
MEPSDDTVIGVVPPSAAGVHTPGTPPAKSAAAPSGSPSEPVAKESPGEAPGGAESAAPGSKPKTTPKKSPSGGTPPKSDAGDGERSSKAGYFLIGRDAGMCLHPSSAGNQLTLAKCDGQDEQRWDFRPDGTIRSKGLCMDVAWGSRENGTAIQVARRSGNPAQQFYLNVTEDLVARIATKCVDIYDGQTANGTPAILWPCTGSANQTWFRR